jgi:hypothetical protein
MTEINNIVNESATAGSSDELIQKGPTANTPAAGEPKAQANEPKINLEDYVPKTQYTELEAKLGTQGQELGEYRKFLGDISPLLDKIQASPELAEAILDDKINSDLVKAIIDGKVSIQAATEVAQAHKEVKEALGTKEYEKLSKTEIENLVKAQVAEQVKSLEKGFTAKISETEEKREFEDSVNEFIKNTPDFKEYAEDISKWLEQNPDQYRIDVAYLAVKGKKSVDAAQKEAQAKALDAAKNVALNAAGGSSQGGQIGPNENIVDSLIRNKSNPNLL